MHLYLKDLINNTRNNKNDVFITNFLCESNIEYNNTYRSFLSECLTIGDEFIAELVNNNELKLLLEQENPTQDVNQQILQILSKYGSQKAELAQDLSAAADSSKDKKSQQVAKQVSQNIVDIQANQMQKNPSMIASFVASGIAKMGNKIEAAAKKASAMFKDPKQAQQALQGAISKLKPVLKNEDGKYITDIQQLVQKNPGWTNVAVGMLINLSKMASIGLASASGGASVAIGAIVGMGLRTIVGRMKGEDWGTAAKKALQVTAISLLSGAAVKGIFNMFKGDGFLSGVKSYFGVGSGEVQGRHGQVAQTQGETGTSNLVPVNSQNTREIWSILQTRNPNLESVLRSDDDWYQNKFIPALGKTIGKNFTNSDSETMSTYVNAIGNKIKQFGDQSGTEMQQITKAVQMAGGLPKKLFDVYDVPIKESFEPIDEGAWDTAKAYGKKAVGAVTGLFANNSNKVATPPPLPKQNQGNASSYAKDLQSRANQNKQQALAEIGKLLGIKASKVNDILASDKLNQQTKQAIIAFFKDYDQISNASQQIIMGNNSSQQGQSGQSGQAATETFNKIKQIASKFSQDFNANLKTLAATIKDDRLNAYVSRASQQALSEMMANPAQGMKDQEKQNIKKANPSVKSQDQQKQQKKNSKQVQQPKEPSKQPQPPKVPKEYTALRDLLKGLVTSIGKELQAKNISTAGVVDTLKNTNMISPEDKNKLINFIKAQWRILKYIRAKITASNKKSNQSQEQPQPSTDNSQQGQQDNNQDYSIEESAYKSYARKMIF